VDIFDGGPTYSVPRDSIRTIERTEVLAAMKGDPADAPERLVSTASIGGFRAIRTKVRIEEGIAVLDGEAIDALRLKSGEMVRVRQ
jgi:arginine N-succinyltransferase